MRCRLAAALLAALLVTGVRAQGNAVDVVEFYNATLDHYFISPLSPDIDALDSGRLPGWARTGFSFFANPAPGAGLNPVCRFYIPPQHGDSHFFTASADECAAVNGKIPVDPNYSGYSFETPNAFYIALPDVTTGACPANTQPVYRLWNQRADSNHRYTTNPGVRSDMLARGYVGEGYGPDSVIMCAPAMAIADKTTRVTAASPLAPGCDGVAPTGFLYTGSEVEPFVAINPRDPNNLIGVWQQDRWSNGGAAALATGVSRDGGQTWARNTVPFSRCTGGNAGNGGDYARASDPWVTISPDGTAYQIALALNGASFTANSSNAVLVSRSADGGSTWSNPVTLIQDGVAFFNDKESITADSTDSRFVYAIWDRLVQNNGGGPTWLARTVNGGQSWNPPVPIYDPGMNSQTINNQIVVLPNGTLVNFFTQLDNDGTNVTAARLSVIRSADKGVTWSAPIPIALVQSVGTTDPASGVRVRDGSTLGAIAVGKNGSLAAAWQDARFSGGARDGIALSRSLDGGLTWSAPVRINAEPAVSAFVPAVAIRDDGAIGVSYYDFRNNTVDPATLLTDYWLTQSTDGVVWTERHVAGPFDLAVAPVANGLFVGDYQGLAALGSTFYSFYAITNGGDAANRTDVFATTASSLKRAAGRDIATTLYADSAPPLPMTDELRARLADNYTHVIATRTPNWLRPLPQLPR